MKAKFLIPALALMALPSTKLYADDDGAQLFRTNCGACHSVGKGKLVGPDLKDVAQRHTEAWILKWVKSSQSMVQAGDKDAVKLFADNNQIAMPDQPVNDDQIKSILAFIKKEGDQPVAANTAQVVNNNGPDAITVATQKAAQSDEDNGSLLTAFSFTEYLLMFLMGILLIVIYVLGMAVKTLTERVKELKEEEMQPNPVQA